MIRRLIKDAQKIEVENGAIFLLYTFFMNICYF